MTPFENELVAREAMEKAQNDYVVAMCASHP